MDFGVVAPTTAGAVSAIAANQVGRGSNLSVICHADASFWELFACGSVAVILLFSFLVLFHIVFLCIKDWRDGRCGF